VSLSVPVHLTLPRRTRRSWADTRSLKGQTVRCQRVCGCARGGGGANRCRRLASDAFATRLMRRPLVCMAGRRGGPVLHADADDTAGPVPRPFFALVQDVGSVAALDGEIRPPRPPRPPGSSRSRRSRSTAIRRRPSRIPSRPASGFVISPDG